VLSRIDAMVRRIVLIEKDGSWSGVYHVFDDIELLDISCLPLQVDYEYVLQILKM
jgi:hypothetical protein